MVVVVVESFSLVSSVEEVPSPPTPYPGSPGGKVASDDGSPTVVWNMSTSYKFREERTKMGKGGGKEGTERVSQLKVPVVYQCLYDYMHLWV